MTCFDWHNLSAEYLDGSLAPALKHRADEHLAECLSCSERHHHYRLILESLRSLARSSPPSDLQHELENDRPTLTWKSALLLLKPLNLNFRPALRSTRVVSITASVLIGLLILGALPKIRRFYDLKIQQRLDANNFAEIPLSASPTSTTQPETENINDFSGEYEEGPEGEGEATDVDFRSDRTGLEKTTSPQVWRFILRTDSPQDLRAKIHRILQTAGALPSSRIMNGYVSPGGIQFDVLVPQSNIDKVRQELSELVNEKTQQNGPSEGAEPQGPYPTSPFTWYRNKSKRPLPQGTARVVVWLSLS